MHVSLEGNTASDLCCDLKQVLIRFISITWKNYNIKTHPCRLSVLMPNVIDLDFTDTRYLRISKPALFDTIMNWHKLLRYSIPAYFYTSVHRYQHLTDLDSDGILTGLNHSTPHSCAITNDVSLHKLMT